VPENAAIGQRQTPVSQGRALLGNTAQYRLMYRFRSSHPRQTGSDDLEKKTLATIY